MEDDSVTERNDSAVASLKLKSNHESATEDDVCQANGYDLTADSPKKITKENGAHKMESVSESKMDVDDIDEDLNNSHDSDDKVITLSSSPLSVNGSRDSVGPAKEKEQGDHCDNGIDLESNSKSPQESVDSPQGPEDSQDSDKESEEAESDDLETQSNKQHEKNDKESADEVKKNIEETAKGDNEVSEPEENVAEVNDDNNEEDVAEVSEGNNEEDEDRTNDDELSDERKSENSSPKTKEVEDVSEKEDSLNSEKSGDNAKNKELTDKASDSQHVDNRGCDSPMQSIEIAQKSDEIIVLDDDDDSPVKEKFRKIENKENSEKPIQVKAASSEKAATGQGAASKESAKPESAKLPLGQGATVHTEHQSTVLKAKPQSVPEFAQDLRPMALNLCTIGMNLVREHVYNDLIKIQSKKLSQNKLNDMARKQLDIIKTAATALKDDNEPLQGELHICKYSPGDETQCGFQSESKNVMEYHLEHPHVHMGRHHCAHCTQGKFVGLSRKDYQFHMEAVHNKKVRFVQPFCYLVCCFCKYETDNPKAFNKHVIKCSKTFNLKRNLEPSPADCDIPLKKPKRPVAPQPAKLPNPTRPFTRPTLAERTYNKPTKPSQPTAAPPQRPAPANPAARQPYQLQQMTRGPAGAPVPMVAVPGAQMQMRPVVPGSQPYPQYLIGNNYYTVVNRNGQLMLQPSNMVVPGSGGAPAAPKPSMAVIPPPPKQQVTIRPPQKVTPPKPTGTPAVDRKRKANPVKVKDMVGKVEQQETPSKNNFQVCEICGGFVKDLQSLRIHFYWKHQIDIPKEVDSPGYTCFLCYNPKAFWTMQGLQLHRASDHSIAGESASVSLLAAKKEAAAKPAVLSPNKSQQALSCYLCGFKTSMILKHLLESHRVSINTMRKMKKCLVCGLELNSIQNLNAHLINIHGLNEQMVNIQVSSPGSAPSKQEPANTACAHCSLTFKSAFLYTKHFEKAHSHKCYRCAKVFTSVDLLQRHFATHKMDKDECQLCGSKVMIGRPFIRHVKREHVKNMSVVLVKLTDEKLKQWVKDVPPVAAQGSSKVDEDEENKKVKEVIEVDGEKIILEVSNSSDEEES